MSGEKLRATQHNARKGKNGVFSVRHNDRNFDLENAKHIDRELADRNWYWHLYQNTQPDLTFEQAEQEAYEKLFREALDAKNERYIQQRHPERVQTMDEYRTNARTCPEETIMQIGTIDKSVDAKTLREICVAQLNWEARTFPNARLLDVALHVDEPGAAPHMHVRRVWYGHDSDGNLTVGQSKALAEMGIQPPHPDQKYGRYNSAKITHTKMCRDHMIELCRERGIELELEPKEKSKSGLDLDEYKAQREQEKAREAQEQARQAQETEQATRREIVRLQQELAEKEAENEKLRAEKESLERANEDLQLQKANAEAGILDAQEKARETEQSIVRLRSSAGHAYDQKLEALRERDEARGARDVEKALQSLEKDVLRRELPAVDILAENPEKKGLWGKIQPATVTISRDQFDHLREEARSNKTAIEAAKYLKQGVAEMRQAASIANMNRIDAQAAADRAAVSVQVEALERDLDRVKEVLSITRTDLKAMETDRDRYRTALNDERNYSKVLKDELATIKSAPDENRELRILFPGTFEKMEYQKHKRELEWAYDNRTTDGRGRTACHLLNGDEMSVRQLLREYRAECAELGLTPAKDMQDHLDRIERADRDQGWER